MRYHPAPPIIVSTISSHNRMVGSQTITSQSLQELEVTVVNTSNTSDALNVTNVTNIS